MKYLLSTFLLLISPFLVDGLVAQTTVRLETPPCRGRMQVFGINGTGYYRLANLKTFREKDTTTVNGEMKVAEKHVFTWEAPDSDPSIYFVGTSMRDFSPVVVGQDPLVQLAGTCGQLRNSTVAGSPANEAYRDLLQTLTRNNSATSQLAKKFNAAEKETDAEAMEAHRKGLLAIDEQKVALVDSLKATNPFLGRIAAANTYLSFHNADQEKHPTGLSHYVNTFWQHTNFADPGYQGMNVVFEATAGYASTLTTALDGPKMEEVLNALFAKWPAGSEAQLYAMGGAFNALNQRRHPAALAVAETIVNQFKATYPTPVAAVEQNFNKLRTSTPGAEAPNLVGTSPTGEEITLEDLKGKIVLIDFWASWCGPCRRENPNVVRMYEKYAEQGFEILGVSLDKDKARWEKAIADDGLTWLHISDLKHWKSAHAKTYGVRSIPDTVLLDREGRIVARSLRGAQLEQRLAQLLGEGK